MAVLPELLEKNLKTMERSQPKLAARLREYVQGLDAFPKPKIQETANGRWISGLTASPFFEPPVEDTAHRKLAKGAVYLVHGAGCPPCLFHVLRALPRDALAVIVIEPSVPVLLHTLASTSVFLALPKGCRISFIVYEDRPLIDEAFEHNVIPLGIFPLSDAVPIIHKGMQESRSERDRSVARRFNEEILFRLVSLGNSPEDTLLGIRHGALNTLRILQSPSFDRLKEQFEGKPFVSVASGPSLEKNVDLLRGMEDRCVIVACDTVLLPLLRRGIRPHIVTTIERPLITYETWVPPVLEEFPEECKKILLLSQSVSHPLIAGRWPGPNIIVGKIESPADTWLVAGILGKTVMASGMSVAHMGFSLAVIMNAPALALIGQDLAYAEDQRTHISGAVSEGIVAIEKSRERIEIPGALGGTVQTHKLWLNFLQIFERHIALYGEKTKVCDCTEGGALIQGTRVLPFAEFLELEVVGRPSYSWNSETISYGEENEIIMAGLENRIRAAFEALERCDGYLHRMEDELQRAVAPALPPERRQEAAYKVAGLLDDCHAAHSVLSFIGQSYTHLAGASLAKNRFMETSEQVKEWKDLHEEIIQSHKINITFLRQWLSYIRAITDARPRMPGWSGASCDSILSDLFGSLSSHNAKIDVLSDDALRISEILCACDLALGEHDPLISFAAAKFLFAQGRSLEARRIMKNIYRNMEGTDQPTDAAAEFFLEWGRMESTPDLCAAPNFERALELVDSADSFSTFLEEKTTSLRRDILEEQRRYYKRYRNVNVSKDLELSILEYRNRAVESLSRHDIPETFEWILKLIECGTERYPGNSLPNAQWLVQTALNCRQAVDPKIADASRKALERLWRQRIILEKRGFQWPSEMMEYLRETGLQVSLENADT